MEPRYFAYDRGCRGTPGRVASRSDVAGRRAEVFHKSLHGKALRPRRSLTRCPPCHRDLTVQTGAQKISLPLVSLGRSPQPELIHQGTHAH